MLSAAVAISAWMVKTCYKKLYSVWRQAYKMILLLDHKRNDLHPGLKFHNKKLCLNNTGE